MANRIRLRRRLGSSATVRRAPDRFRGTTAFGHQLPLRADYQLWHAPKVIAGRTPKVDDILRTHDDEDVSVRAAPLTRGIRRPRRCSTLDFGRDVRRHSITTN